MNLDKITKYSIVFMAIVLMALVLKNLQSFIRPLFLAIVITLLLNPLERFSRKIKVPFWATLSGLGILAICLLVGITVVGNYAMKETAQIYEQIPQSRNQLTQSLEELSSFQALGYELDLSMIINIGKINRFIERSVDSFIRGITTFFTELFLSILFVLFLFPTHQKFLDKIKDSLDETGKSRLSKTFFEVEMHIKEYLSTKTLISFLTALVSGSILWLFGSRYVFILMLVIFAFNYIPNVGSIFATIIVAITYVLQSGVNIYSIMLIILLTTVQMFFGNYLDPKITGSRLKLSPLLVLLSLFLWHWIWGPIGMVLAVPITSIIKIVLENIHSTEKIAKLME